jgi:NAD(P)-dependent dehydrogenase (short-subunit alcohol dehydrogenase family)
MTEISPVAIVTGGARRIGRAIVEDLVGHGWAVAIHFNQSRDEATALATLLRECGGRVVTVGGDFTDTDCLKRIVADATAALGPPTLLVNNASIFERDSMGDLERRQWDRQMTVNLTAPVFLTQAFAQAVPDGAEGNVINLLDQRIWKPTPNHFSYQTSKSALFVATQTLAQALAPRIRVNGIAPGPALPSASQSEERFRKMIDAILLQRPPDLGDFGRTVRYLVENRSITGQVIALDGGQHLGWQTPDIAAIEK